MAQFRIPTRNDRYGFDMSVDARITEFKLANTADLIGNLILAGVEPSCATEFRNSREVTIILDWYDEEKRTFGMAALTSCESGYCATMNIQVPASKRLQLEMKAAIMEEWNEVTVTKLREFGFSEPYI